MHLILRRKTLREWFELYGIAPVLHTTPDWRAMESRSKTGFVTIEAYRSDSAPNERPDGIINICLQCGERLPHDRLDRYMDSTFMEYNRSLGWFDLRLTDW